MASDAMRIAMRLSAKSDIDLLVLSQSGVSLQSVAKVAILSYLQGQEFKISANPPERINRSSKTIQFRFSNPQVVAWLTNIPDGQRSAAIKALIRRSVEDPMFFLGISATTEKHRVSPPKQTPAYVTKPIANRSKVLEKESPLQPNLEPRTSPLQIELAEQEAVVEIKLNQAPSSPSQSFTDENIFDFI